MINWFTGRDSVDFEGQYIVRVTAEFEGVLAERVYYTTFVVEGLAAIYDTQAEILLLLERQSGNR